mmetsp:Transcript_41804/g.87760  ORF Transcript_41804/g.87760 Transcript_41804/m.87760 type:complete len:887 (-) Transcript_41804:467-3127(-)
MMLQRAFRLSLLLQIIGSYPTPAAAASDRQINAIASTGNYIHAEQEIDLSSTGYLSQIDIKSDVPVTIQRYSDDQFLIGQKPVPDNMAKVLVTSNCDTSVSQVVPNIDVSTGSISVSLDVDGEDTDFLQPSSYSAIWTWISDCFDFPQTTAPSVIEKIPGTVVPESSCEIGSPCYEEGSTCSIGTETCCGVTHDSIQCNCEPSMNGSLQYSCMHTEACMIPSCCRSGSAEGMPPPAPGTCAPGSLCNSGVEDDYCCTSMDGLGTYCSKTGGATSETTSTTTIATDVPPTSSPTGSPRKETTTTSTSATSAAAAPTAITTAATSAGETATNATTTVTMTTAVAGATVATNSGDTATTDASTATVATSFAVDGNLPTKEPTKPLNNEVPTKSPKDWWEESEFQDGVSSRNSAFSRSRSLSVAITFVAIVVISTVFPPTGGNNYLWGYGKFAVAAVAISSLYPKTPPDSKGASVRKSNTQVPNTFRGQNERALETCTFNVEILIDGCNHPLDISAPSGRVVDVVIEGLVSEEQPNCATDYEATLNFPVTTETIVLDLEDGGFVGTLDRFNFNVCTRAVPGRPFVDATGGSLHAMPWVPDDEVGSMVSALSWTNEDLTESQISRVSNATDHGRVFLGEDWIQRALGEHASIASFSAFSIALMSNGAPAVLVNDALKAGLDEVRHAQASFDIASKLTGREVGPGLLPESKLEFGQDLKTLALAVAKEGCLDETLSAFSAAMEVAHIDKVLDNQIQDSLYYSIDRDLLGSIKNELAIIAVDESKHSGLAWRTLSWVCSVDSNVCDEVNMNVFEESNVEMRFNQRANSSFGETSRVLHSVREEWNKILSAHQLGNSGLKDESICEDDGMGEDHSGQTLLDSVVGNIIRQVLHR